MKEGRWKVRQEGSIPLSGSSENTYLPVTGVSVDIYPQTVRAAHYFSSSTAKFNWTLLKTVIIPKIW